MTSPNLSTPEHVPPAKVKYDPAQRKNEPNGLPQPELPPPPMDCPQCKKTLPAEAFQQLPQDRRCRYCIAHDNQQEIIEDRTEQARDMMVQVLDKAKSGEAAFPLIEELCSEMVESFGGMKMLVYEWQKHFRRCLDHKGPPSIGALNHFSAFFKLINDVNKTHNQMAAAEMSDEQLKRAAALEMAQLLIGDEADENQAKNQRSLLIQLIESQGVDPRELIAEYSSGD